MAELNNGNDNGAIDEVEDENIQEVLGISNGAEGEPRWDELEPISVPSKADYRLGPIPFDMVFGEPKDPPLVPPSPVALVSFESDDGGSSSAGNSGGPISTRTRSKQSYPSSVDQTSISETNSNAIKINETGGTETTEDSTQNDKDAVEVSHPVLIKRSDTKFCFNCKTKSTPLWRSGPDGKSTICNACGMQMRYRKEKRLD